MQVLVSSYWVVKVFNVGASVGEDELTGSIQLVNKIPTKIFDPSYIAVSPTSVGVRVQAWVPPFDVQAEIGGVIRVLTGFRSESFRSSPADHW